MSKKREKEPVKEIIEKTILDSGLWDNDQQMTHGFILSPDVYVLTKNKQKEFEKVGLALYDCLAGLGKIAAMNVNPKIASGRTWEMIGRVFRTGIPKSYRDIQILYPDFLPYICKVDFIEGIDGKFWIAEIDGYNKHGLGYSTLVARMTKAIQPRAKTFPGVANFINKIVKKNKSKANQLVLLYSNQERFYLPEFSILKQEFKKLEVNLFIASEDEFKIKKNHWLFIDFPILSNSKLRESLIQLYQKRKIHFLIPPKPFFSSKAVLALLKNDIQDKELEKILQSQISSSSLKKIRKYIPETYLINKREKENYWRKLSESGRFIIKEAFSSGSKGIIFPDEQDFNQALKKAYRSGYSSILQKRIINTSNKFSYFTKDGDLKRDKWYSRFTIHFTPKKISSMVITARRNKRVHGALDCLQIGTILE